MSDIEQEAARRAYEAGFGVSEWVAFLTPEEALTLLLSARDDNEVLRSRLAEGEEIVAEGIAIHDRLKAENEALRAALQKIVNNWDNLHPKDRQQARAALALSRPAVGAILERTGF